MMVSNRNLLFQGSIFRFHVCFGGCNRTQQNSTNMLPRLGDLESLAFWQKITVAREIFKPTEFVPLGPSSEIRG